MMRAKDDYRSLNGLQKAALLVMSVGEETAAKIFQLMHDDEIREISQTMANLGTVNATVLRGFASATSKRRFTRQPAITSATRRGKTAGG